jgi:hypothetical protein
MDSKSFSEEEIDGWLRSMGFLYPQTENELKSFNELYSDFPHELNGSEISTDRIFKEVKEEENRAIETRNTPNLYFKRVVLAAEIANQLHAEPTFGHVKFQKLVYLCEHRCRMKLSDRYCKQVAGPFDRKFMHSIDTEFSKQGWFDVTQETTFGKFVYTPLPGLEKYKKYYQNYFAGDNDSIQDLIDLFRKESTQFVELIATLFACWDEGIRKKEFITDATLVDNLYKWSKEKEKYQTDDVLLAIDWMKEKRIVPTG